MEKHIGDVGVDSGTVLIGDPCYWTTDKYYENILLPEMLKNNDYFSVKFDDNELPLKGVISQTVVGDGIFPVYAVYDKSGDLLRLEVRFQEEIKEFDIEIHTNEFGNLPASVIDSVSDIINPDDLIVPEDRVIIHFDYPEKFERSFESKDGFTRSQLFIIIQETYKEIFEDIKQGKYGIQFHDISDLVIEGLVYTNEHIKLQIGT